MMLEKMKALAKAKDTCVLATVSGGIPHCSLMAYVINEDCTEIFMVTHRQTTKYRNLNENPAVSLLVDTREEHTGPLRPKASAMTIDGTFEHISDEQRRRAAHSLLLIRHPHLLEFLDHPDSEIFCIRVSSFLLLEGITDAYYEELK